MKTPFKIEKGIPVSRATHAKPIYPFGKMVPGDSFLVPQAKTLSVRVCATRFGKLHPGFKLVTRRTPEGTRCWCLTKGGLP